MQFRRATGRWLAGLAAVETSETRLISAAEVTLLEVFSAAVTLQWLNSLPLLTHTGTKPRLRRARMSKLLSGPLRGRRGSGSNVFGTDSSELFSQQMTSLTKFSFHS